VFICVRSAYVIVISHKVNA